MKGECYFNAYKLLENLHRSGLSETDPSEKNLYLDLVLVLGNVTPENGPDANHSIEHAWVEMAGYAYEVSQSITKPSIAPIDYYRDRYHATHRIKYDYGAATRLRDKSGIYGPWDLRGWKNS